mgnify:FL=1
MNNSKFKIKHSKLATASLKDLGNKVFAFSELNIDVLNIMEKLR